ncbi:DUF6731 family protein [Levilactobacillus brevis]|uniref:DUF6731 family protein n=1 Tax=Levilactobacillus brevis TaxID=1580 RepID=UPI003D17E9EE
MAKLSIRFNYYFPTLKYIEDDTHDGIPEYWDMRPFCDWILNTKVNPSEDRPAMAVPLQNQEFGDLEWRFEDSRYDEQNNLYYIRLKKLRSSNLPAIATRGGDSEDVSLDDNQFLGEFNLLVFDPVNQRAIVQSNFFGLSQKQVELALSAMRLAWKHAINEPINADNPGIVDLEIIPDDEALRHVGDSGIYRSIDVKSSDIQALTRTEINSNTLNSALELASSINGVTFHVQIGLAYTQKDRTLDNAETRNLIGDIERLNELTDTGEAPAQLSVKARQTVDDPLENVDILLPKLRSYIRLVDEGRSTLGAGYIYTHFIEDNYLNEEQHFQQRARIAVPRV